MPSARLVAHLADSELFGRQICERFHCKAFRWQSYIVKPTVRSRFWQSHIIVGSRPIGEGGPNNSPGRSIQSLGSTQRFAMIAASSRFEVPSARSDFTNKSSDTVGSPASIFATRD